jgi:hypothetical protein
MVKTLRIVFLFFCSTLCSYTFATDLSPNYHWGRGLGFPAAQLNLGGYLNASFEHIDSQNIATLDDFSLFVSWSPTARLHFFSELEIEDWLSTAYPQNFNNAFRIERLYLDYLATENTTVRLGKYLTPVGRWNVTHASPLVWTTTRPLITSENFFPSHASGLMLSNRFNIHNHDLDVSVYADDSITLDPRKNRIDFNNAFGARVNYQVFEQFQLGFSYLDFQLRSQNPIARNHLFGLDLQWKHKGFEIQAELGYRLADDFQGDEKGLYIQGVVPVIHHVFVVGRYEYLTGVQQLNSIFFQKTTNLGITGITWRPFVPLAIKAEYRFGSGNNEVAPTGVFTSLSFFF